MYANVARHMRERERTVVSRYLQRRVLDIKQKSVDILRSESSSYIVEVVPGSSLGFRSRCYPSIGTLNSTFSTEWRLVARLLYSKTTEAESGHHVSRSRFIFHIRIHVHVSRFSFTL